MTQVVLPHTIDAGTEITAIEHQENYVAIRDIINGGIEGGTGPNANIAGNTVSAANLADLLLLRGLGISNGFEGVMGGTDLQVTPGAGLVLNYGGGNAWIRDDTGVVSNLAYIPVNITGGSVTVGAANGANPRIDQIIATMSDYATGTVSVLAGTATAGATLANRTGAAALPNNAIRLADILVPAAFAGPFVQATHIRDRRPWARGAHMTITRTTDAGGGSDYTSGVSAGAGQAFEAIDATNLDPRMEIQSGRVIVCLYGFFWGSGGSGLCHFEMQVDGVASGGRREVPFGGTDFLAWDLSVAAGSHDFKPVFRCVTAGQTANVSVGGGYTLVMSISEDLRQDAQNSGA